MPPHKDILDDHAIASIATFIRNRFGHVKGSVNTLEVTAIRKATKK